MNKWRIEGMDKETTSKILIDFMDRNREYAIESYLKTE